MSLTELLKIYNEVKLCIFRYVVRTPTSWKHQLSCQNVSQDPHNEQTSQPFSAFSQPFSHVSFTAYQSRSQLYNIPPSFHVSAAGDIAEAGGAGARDMVRETGLCPLSGGIRHRPGKRVALPVPLLPEWRR